MHLLCIPAALSLLASGPDSESAGNGVVKEEVRQVSNFRRVLIEQGLEAEISPGALSVRVRGDENLIPLVKTDVEGDQLVLRVGKDHGYRSRAGLKVIVSVPSLEGAAVSSGARLILGNFSGERLELHASSGGSVKAAGLSEGAVNVELSSGSQMQLAGKAKALEVACSGGANVRAGDLTAQAVKVQGSGGAEAEVDASASIRGNLSGGAALTIRGAPAVRELTTSSGASYRLVGVREL